MTGFGPRVLAIWTGVGLGHAAALGLLWGSPSVGRADGDGLLMVALLSTPAPTAKVAVAPVSFALPLAAAASPVSLPIASRPMPVEGAVARATPAPFADAVLNPARFLSRTEPVYPREARRAGVEGTARVRLRLGADGAVLEAEIVGSSGSPALDAAALAAARDSRYAPAQVGLRPVPSETEAAYRFELR